MKTKQEIDIMIAKCEDNDIDYSGMSYEEGVAAALEWVMGYIDEVPIEDSED